MVADIAADERLLTAEQVAQRLSVTEQTLAHWRSTGRVHLPYVAISRRCVRYRYEDVERFINERIAEHT
jgi:predicted site-specific integrase-resolvase